MFCLTNEMNWISEWFDKQGRELNKLMQGDSSKREKALVTGILSLRDSGMKTLPEYIFSASEKVKVLDATNNDLRELPDRFSSFKILHKAHFARNKLESLPPSICLQVRQYLLRLEVCVRVLLLENWCAMCGA